jgi:hypothetical protein
MGRLDLNLPLENFVVSQNIALAFSILIVMLWNYFANRYWTYSNVPTGEKIADDKNDDLTPAENEKDL